MRPAVYALAVLLAGCNAMQSSPVAPSAFIPAASPSGPLLPNATTFDVTLLNGTNPNETFAGNTWLGFLTIQPRGGALITTPARVTFDCGNGSVTAMAPGNGIGLQVTCFFATPQIYTVRAEVESVNGATTASELAVAVRTPPPDMTAVAVNIDAAKDTSTISGLQLWTFTPTVTGPAVSLAWNFGDGRTLTTGPGQVMTHAYTANGIYVITATPKLTDGSTRPPGRTEIIVSGL